MSIIKSLSVGNGDMFYIKHGSSNFTIIDCCLTDDNRSVIINEIKAERKGKNITRFISTHPDEDHIQQLDYLDDEIEILNFYCVSNKAIKSTVTPGFTRYCKLRDSEKAFFLSKGCSRKWMNQSGDNDNGEDHGSAGINILWPDTNNENYKEELQKSAEGTTFNNISSIVKYSLNGGVTAIWMGDLETDFMDSIVDDVVLPKTNLLFAPHHGRKSGRIPSKWITAMNPDIIIMGEANANNSDYTAYPNHNKIRQNSAWDITFECEGGKVHCYSSNPNYSVDFLDNERASAFKYYIGTLNLGDA
jgi:beta-lactamase superfamily II metal-dependent hydrolase